MPPQAVIVGDETLVDIKIPKALGMRTILLDRESKISKKPFEADSGCYVDRSNEPNKGMEKIPEF